MDEGRRMCLIFPTLIQFPNNENELRQRCREKFVVRKHIFYGQRVMDVPDGREKWEGLDDKSRLMEECQ